MQFLNKDIFQYWINNPSPACGPRHGRHSKLPGDFN